MPDTDDELLSSAMNHREYRSGDHTAAVEEYLRPTTAWPDGRDAVIASRLKLATAHESMTRKLLQRAQMLGVSWPDATDADFLKLPIPLLFDLLSLGLMNGAPPAVTRDALAVFSPMALFSLLSLDPPIGERRPPSTDRGQQEVRDLRAFESLLPVLTTYGERVLDPKELRRVLLVLQKLMNARAAISMAKAQQEREERRRRESFITMTDGGWTIAAVGHRRAQISRLVDGLRAAKGADWPFRRVVELILAGETDWIRCPCPAFVASYRDRPDELLDLLKKDYKRGRAAATPKSRKATGAGASAG